MVDCASGRGIDVGQAPIARRCCKARSPSGVAHLCGAVFAANGRVHRTLRGTGSGSFLQPSAAAS